MENQDTGNDELDHHLPIANISRIMKKVLPSNAQVSKVQLIYLLISLLLFN